MRKIKFYQIDAFSDEIFGGNPTAVFLQAEQLADSEMKKIAREMNLSESAFMLPSTKADFKLRFFTPPGAEIKFCGHATIGTLCTIAHEGLFGVKAGAVSDLKVETNAGTLAMTIDMTDPKNPAYSFAAPKIDMAVPEYHLSEVVSALGIPSSHVETNMPLMIERTNNYLFFAVPSIKHLGELNVNFQSAAQYASRDGIVVFCAIAKEACGDNQHIHCRGYAPFVGVPEDPFTGSMMGGVCGYIVQNELIPQSANQVVVEQGRFIGRPGKVEMEISRGTELKARLTARAVAVFKSEITLPGA
jgi:trans-2,3-dihydro-3-hydroxyanthranilate isomerase